MRNFVLLLVLASGLLAGYMIGSWRGSDAVKALQKAMDDGKALDAQRQIAISKLQSTLDGINEKHQAELQASRQNYAAEVAKWRLVKDDLNGKIFRMNAKLSESDNQLQSVLSQLGSASEKERNSLEQRVAELRQQQRSEQLDVQSASCLKARVPSYALDVLKIANGSATK